MYDETSIKNWPDLEKILFTKKVYSNLKNELDKNAFKRVRCVNSQWVSECLKKKSLISTANYELKPLRKVLSEKKENLFAKSSQAHKRHAQLEESEDDSKRAKTSLTKTDILDILTKSDGSDSEGEFFSASESPDKTKSPLKKPVQTQTFVCAHSSSEQPVNPNKFLTDKLDELGSIYDKTKDRFRALSYQKASAVLKRHPEAVTSYEQAIKLPGIGKNIAEKIAEIAQTGELRKLNNINQREDLSAIKLFTDIHGVGPTTAQQFVNQGFRTLEDLKERAHLTRQQKIGIKYYDEFKQRIPRDEVALIEQTVKDAALSINSGLIVQTCGSYRRGKATCGDVDILITHADGHSHKAVMNKLLEMLHESGFLTDDLALQDERSDSQRKYLGVCKLPGDDKLHRRLDIITVPYDEYACALLYFTGSAHFNRSMRSLAHKYEMSLSEHSLNKNVKRKGNAKVSDGEPIKTLTEEDVFKCLNLPYRKPEERDF